LTSKSSKGREAARSWLGWAAAWTDGGGLQGGHAFHHGLPVADVEFMVVEVLPGGLQPAPVPRRVARGAEESGPHVVVQAMDFPVPPGEIGYDLAADQAARSGDQ